MRTALLILARVAAALAGLASLGFGAMLALIFWAGKVQDKDAPATATMIAVTLVVAAFCFIPKLREIALWRHFNRNVRQTAMAVDLVRPDRDALSEPADLTNYNEMAWLGALTQRIAVVSLILVLALAALFSGSGMGVAGGMFAYAVLGFFFPRVIGYFVGALLIIFCGFAMAGIFDDVPRWAGILAGLVSLMLAAVIMRRDVSGAIAALVITSWNAVRGVKEPWVIRPSTKKPAD
jgi:MFS family permease